MERPDKALGELCAASAWEMEQLRSQMQALEDVVLDVLERGTAPTSQELRSLQDFDLVIQTLSGLSGFYRRVQAQVDEAGPADLPAAAAGVTLEKLRDRLRSASSMAST
ncbi:hypothetical protein KUW17_14155 [Leisingera aquaemixtae]|uniref:hypothetical protein n=1 Tax=Leisingera TaxID=191028 RepID=UPI001C9882D2|nr:MULTISPECIES: hypothetical protein [Leisingera]MBY6067896.1 hypothetical protein [Leisingera aquaemixtae]MCB4458200.1 hypothetical protein [Leisingera sp. McT4-56]